MSLEDGEASQLTYADSEFIGGEFDSSYESGYVEDGVLVLKEDWEQVEDEGSSYWFNSKTNESQWDEPAWTPMQGTADYNYDDYGYADEYEQEEKTMSQEDPTGVTQALAAFVVPDLVPKRWTDFGQSILFHGVKNPSSFLRINVFTAVKPTRESFRLEETAPDEWSTKMVFYAFAKEMPNTVRYDISYSMNPFRNRLLPQKAASQAKRDISRWNTSRKIEETGFWAFPVHVPGSQLLYVDWTSSPDRYKITTDPAPEWQWTRCFSFFAYTACKFHVLECKDPQCYKIVEGHTLGDSIGLDENGDQWDVILAFYAFKTQVPGTNKYYIQHQTEPHYRTRIGMEPSQSANKGWVDHTEFYAFDTAMPGTSKFFVQYTVRSTEAYSLSAEQFRIYTKDPWGQWENKFALYAFPAEQVKVWEKNDNDADGKR